MKKILITGATDGIGKLAALKLAHQNHQLLIHGRNEEKLQQVKEEIIHHTGNSNINTFMADLSSLTEVRKLAKSICYEHDSLDILINNAGVGFIDQHYGNDGIELRLAVNYIAPFLLTHLLLPRLKKAAPSRVVNVSSAGQEPIDFNNIMLQEDFDSFSAYRQSKLALIMFSIDMAEKLKNHHITVNC